MVVVFLESLGTTHIGAYGNPLNPTPHVDKLMLLKTFKDKGLYDDTIFVFFGDHQGYKERVDFMPEYIY